jgi:nucleoside 2-deoxyribosyltransferase
MFKIYLAGSIEKSVDQGVGAREEIIKNIVIPKVEFVNPCDFAYNQDEYPTMWSYVREPTHTFHDCLEYVQTIGNGDMDEVRKCDMILAILDQTCGPGTASEMTGGKIFGIPVWGYLIDYWREIHPWILSRVDEFFSELDELRTNLKWLISN